MNSLNDLHEIQVLYRGWVNNRIMALVMAIQVNRNWSARSLMKSEFFLEDIERHFIGDRAGPKVRRAFRYLRQYLHVPVESRAGHKHTALKMVGLIYEALGFEKIRITGPDTNRPGKNPPDPHANLKSTASVFI